MPQIDHRATSRVLDIMELLSSSNEGFNLTEIAQALDSPKSSILPMLQTMNARGFIDLDYRSNRYTIGANLFYAGSIYRSKITANRFIDEEMRQLTRRLGESCCLGVMRGDQVLFLHRTDPAEPICCYKVPGQTELGCIGAMGKALLCDYRLPELTDLFLKDGHTLPPTLNLYQAHIQMEEVRVTGLSYEYGNVESGVQCVAAPIRVRDNVVAAIGVILPVFRMNPDQVLSVTKLLPMAVRKIENMLSTTENPIEEVFSLDGFRNL